MTEAQPTTSSLEETRCVANAAALGKFSQRLCQQGTDDDRRTSLEQALHFAGGHVTAAHHQAPFALEVKEDRIID